MRVHAWVVLGLAMSVAAAQDIDLLAEASAWQAGTDGTGATMVPGPTPDARLAVRVDADGGAEDYPKLTLPLPEPQDWERFMRLRSRVRVTCDDPAVAAKNLTLVLYDQNTLREDLPDRPMTQQCIGHTVPVGQWVEFRDWLLTINRSSVPRLQLYLYEAPPGTKHTYTWEFAELQLEGVGEQAVAFDTEVYSDRAIRGARSETAAEVGTGDGLGLRLGRRGDVAVRLDGKAVGAPGNQPTGLLVRDAMTTDPPMMVGGEVRRDGRDATQRAEMTGPGLRVEATYRAGKDYLEVAGTVTDLRGADRAVTVYLALPVGDEPWTWWDSVAAPRTSGESGLELSYLEAGMGFGQNGMHSKYPLGAVTRPGVGLTLAVRMDEPVVHRIAYNPELRLFFVAVDLGLVSGQTIHGRSLAEAPFRFLLYRHDAEWGFRSALQRYYGFFPQFFTQRVETQGGWYVWGDMASTEGALDAGFRFHWGPSGPEAVKWDNEHGVLSLLYIEPDFYQQTMGDYPEAPTPEQAIERLRKVAEGDETELAAMEKLSYSTSYAPGNWVQEHSLREAVRTVSQAAMGSVSYDAAGRPYAQIGQFPWMGESQWGCIFPNNLDPDIPGGKGAFNVGVYLDYNLKAVEDAGARFSGIGLDSLCGYGQFSRANYRRDQFPYADVPLSFSATDRQPVLVGPFGTVEWLKALAEEMHGRGLVLMTNCSWGMTPGWLTFGAPYLDIFGAEATQFADPDFIRAIAYRKSCSDLPYNPRPPWEVAWHLLHGIYPGHGNELPEMTKHAALLRELNGLGWEPLTYARVDPPTLRLERYGSGASTHLVLHNPGDRPAAARVTLDLEALGLPAGTSAASRFGPPAEWADGVAEFTLGAKETTVLTVNGAE